VKKRKFLAGLVAPIALLGLIVSLSGFQNASADISTSASVGTVPQCVWVLTGVGDAIPMSHPSTGLGDTHPKYVGLDFYLSGSGTSTSGVFAGPSNATTVSALPDNCSWYGGSNAATSGAEVNFSVSANPTFTGIDATIPADTSMNFPLDASATLGSHTKVLNVVVTGSCGSNWSGLAKTGGTYPFATGALTTPVAHLASTFTNTQSSCTWATALNTYVPGGVSPLHAADTYNFTGPAITTTLTATGITN